MMSKKKNQKNQKNAIEGRFKDLLDLDTPTIITLYGRPGSGKTTITGSLPKPIFFIDVKDKGWDSLKRAGVKKKDVTIFSIDHFDDLYEAYDYLDDNPSKFKSVVIDHMTALQEFAMDKVKDEEGKDQMSQRMYGIAGSYMKEVISLYKNLIDHSIIPCFLAEDRTEDGEGEGEDQLMPEVGPAVMPSVAKNLCAASRVIGHTYLQEKVEKTSNVKVKRTIEYRLRLGPNPYYITKVTRPLGAECPAYLVDATFSGINNIVKGIYKASKEPKKAKKKKPKK